MAAIEQTIRWLLIGSAEIAAIVGDRIFPMQIPAAEPMPAITYQVISAVKNYTMAGQEQLIPKRFQISCWSTSYAGAGQLAEMVNLLLSGYHGTIEERQVSGIFAEGEVDLMVDNPEIEQLRRFGKALDFMVWYQE